MDITNTDQAVYDLTATISSYGERIKEAAANAARMAAEVTDVLAGDDPTRGTWTYSNIEDPARLLNDMTALCKIAQTMGVPDDLLCQARRGEYVSHYAVRAVSERRIEPDDDDGVIDGFAECDGCGGLLESQPDAPTGWVHRTLWDRPDNQGHKAIPVAAR